MERADSERLAEWINEPLEESSAVSFQHPKRASISQIKSFWEEQSKGGLLGAHGDQNITDLESWYVIRYALKRYRPKAMMDVGCGNGDRTKLLSSYVKGKTLGLDYSKGMISLAKKRESDRLSLIQADLLTEPSLPFQPDMIVSCRCLINLGSQANVRKVLRYFHRILQPGGRLVLCEGSRQGHIRLNRLRREMGLKDIQTVSHNINLDEKGLERSMSGLFEFTDLSRLGVYYLITRALYPKSIEPNEPDPKSKINMIALQIQKKVGIGVAEDFGRHYCTIGTKV